MDQHSDTALLAEVDRLCMAIAGADSGAPWGALLDLALQRFACQVGSIHVIDPKDGLLHLRVARGIPDRIRPQVERIPVGKGMAGLAAERRAPVGACNLQTDSSGDVRPGARLTEMKGSLCAPMLDGDLVRGTFGVARSDEHVFDAVETGLLLAIGARVARAIASI